MEKKIYEKVILRLLHVVKLDMIGINLNTGDVTSVVS